MSRTSQTSDDLTPPQGREIRNEAVDRLLRAGSSDDPTADADLQAWLGESEAHRTAYRSVERAWRLAGSLPASDDAGDGEQTAPRRYRHRRVWSADRPGIGRRRVFGFAVAVLTAACLALLVLPSLRLHLLADHVTGKQQRQRIALADGSVVHLDAHSAIAVRFTGSRRAVELLAGRAFFEVVAAPGQLFVVDADGVHVRVTGTAFGVRADRGRVGVEVRSGSVAVDTGDSITNLASGDQLTVWRADGRRIRTAASVEDIAAWIEGRMVVDGAPLSDVVEEFGRRQHGMILIADDELAARRVTGVFDLGRPVDALQAIARAQGATLTVITPYLLILSGP